MIKSVKRTLTILIIKNIIAFSLILSEVIILEENTSKNNMPTQYITQVSCCNPNKWIDIKSENRNITPESKIDVIRSIIRDVRPTESLSRESCL